MIGQFLASTRPDVAFDENSLTAFLESLIENRLMVGDGTHYLSLAVRSRPVRSTAPQAVDAARGGVVRGAEMVN
jgi:hypothetical protein